ncbi:MAG: glutathione S-transferase family protein [Azospirillaceae bacterium]
MADHTLVIGNKAYSSWSLRGWLGLTLAGIEFAEILVPLDQPETRETLLKHSPTGLVPLLKTPRGRIWESLAILEYANELNPEAGLWPADGHARAVARSAASEMHTGFAALRRDMSMDLKHDKPGIGHTSEALADVARLEQLWGTLRAEFGSGGDFLFGATPGAADVMFVPVAARLRTYHVPVDRTAQAYAEALLDLPAVRDWYAAAAAEPWVLEDH